MSFTESEEHRLLRDAVQKIASRFGAEYYLQRARNNGRLTELWSALAEPGYLSVNLPEAYGGGGLGMVELALVCEEVAAAGCPLLLMLVSPAICGTILARFGTEAQKERWLRPLCQNRLRMAFAITEPDAGSNSHQLGTRATPDGDGYRLSGTKYYISGVDEVEAVLVVTRTNPQEGQPQLANFIVDTKDLQKSVIPMEFQAPEKQYTLFFDGLHVGRDRLVGEEPGGLKQVFAGLNPERILGAALANGVARHVLGRAVGYAKDRKVFKDVPIGSYQGIAHPLAKAFVEVELARLMTRHAASLYDDGHDAGLSANMAKYAAAEAALAAVDQAIQTHGGNGLSQEYGIATYWGIARTLRIAPVSREMILNYVAQHGLGLPRSY
jgi:alkylation response protein AidB-like acyl-CoA dehydrogenase